MRIRTKTRTATTETVQTTVNDALLAEYQTLLSEYRQQLAAQRQQIYSLQSIIEILAEQQAPKYDLRGAQFAGGFAETVQGNQVCGQFCVYADIDTS